MLDPFQFPWQIYFTCAVGIVISVILPILRALLPKPLDPPANWPWEVIRPYVVLGLFSLVGAVLIVAASWESLKDWRAALLAGYAWDSTLQKLKALS